MQGHCAGNGSRLRPRVSNLTEHLSGQWRFPTSNPRSDGDEDAIHESFGKADIFKERAAFWINEMLCKHLFRYQSKRAVHQYVFL